jgi:hypothetical protein
VRYIGRQLHPHLTCFQKGETESRMKTGAVEEVSENIKVNLDNFLQFDTHLLSRS